MAVKFASVRAIRPVPFGATWDELRSALTEHRESESKMSGELWSPVEYLPNSTRSAVSVSSVSCLVCDLDGESYESVVASVERFEHLAYTTWSHSHSSPHFHIVFPLAVPVDGAEWRGVWVALHHHLGIKGDPATKDPSRIYFLPQHAIGAPFQVVSNRGDLLDPRTVGFRPDPVRSPRRTVREPRVARHDFTDPRWWDEPVDLSQYDGMSQAEIHRDIQREWAEFKSRNSSMFDELPTV